MANENISNNETRCGEGDSKKSDSEIEVKLRVIEERILKVQLDQLRSKPETMLAKMFTSGMAKANEKGEYQIHNVKPKILEGILDYYKKGVISIPENVSYEDMNQACDYLQIPFTEKTVQNWKLFLEIKADYHKRELVQKLFENEITTHLNKISESGKTYSDVYFVKISDCDYSKENSVPSVDNIISVVFYVEDKFFDIFLNDDQETGYIKKYLSPKGFNTKFEVTKEKITYILCKFKW